MFALSLMAYASMDIRELKKIWPTLSRKQQKELQDAFEQARAVKVELRQRKFTIGGNSATVCVISGWYTRVIARFGHPRQLP